MTAFRSTIPFESERIGACAIYCSDGRYNEQFDEFLHTALGLPRYDRLTLPGGAAALAGHIASHRDEHALDDQLTFLIRAHSLERIVLIAHAECGYYAKKLFTPAHRLRETQERDLASAAARIASISSSVHTDAYIAGVTRGVVEFEAVRVGVARSPAGLTG